ncbi:hypothetical protein TSAR_012708, partial [Trichomalopsis sarcophagae]
MTNFQTNSLGLNNTILTVSTPTLQTFYFENKNIILKQKLSNLTTNTESELYAVLMALRYIKSNNIKNSVIFSDSNQALPAKSRQLRVIEIN